MDDQKYVVIKGSYPVVFSAAMQHSEFRCLGSITSAGFFWITERNGKPHISTYGNSVSLNLKPDTNDANLLKRLLFPIPEY